MVSDTTPYLVRKLVPLQREMEIEFTTVWCHVQFVSLDDAKRTWGWSDAQNSDEGDAPTGFALAEFRGEARFNIHRSYDPLLLSRPSLIKLLCLLSYFSNEVFTTGSPSVTSVDYSHPSHPDLGPPLPPLPSVEKPRLVMAGCDRSAELSALLAFAAQGGAQSSLLFSLLDRWRKGRFLLGDGFEDITTEEAALCLFHVLENVAEYFHLRAESELKSRSAAFVNKILDEVLLPETSARGEIYSRLHKDISRILVGPENLTTRTQLAFAFKFLGLLDDKTHALISRLVKLRNTIAHGRLGAGKEYLAWPALPFFLQSDPRDADLFEPLLVLSARTIAALCGTSTWQAEWQDVKSRLHPSDSTILEFVRSADYPSPPAFETGEKLDVRPSSVAWYWLRKGGKLGLKWLEDCLGAYIATVEVADGNAWEAIFPALLLADSSDLKLASAARAVTCAAFGTEALDYVQPSDLWKELAQYGVEPPWLTSWARANGPPDEEEDEGDNDAAHEPRD